MNEEWKIIDDYNHRYMISNFGRAKSITRKKEQYLKGTKDSDGYLIFTFYYGDGSYKKAKAHRLVAIHFIANHELKPTVNHKDGNKANNHYLNLEWATHSEQTRHAYNTGLLVCRENIIFTDEHKRNISLGKMGSIPWNKGKKGLQTAWNKGLKQIKN